MTTTVVTITIMFHDETIAELKQRVIDTTCANFNPISAEDLEPTPIDIFGQWYSGELDDGKNNISSSSLVEVSKDSPPQIVTSEHYGADGERWVNV